MPISRDTFLKRIFAQLEMLQCDRENTNLITLVDGDLQLFEIARNLTVASKFHQRLCVYRRKGRPNVGSVWRRRQRIADIHNEMKQWLNNADEIFMIEDDTLFPTNALSKLLSIRNEYPYAGIISGVEIGRWGYTHIGAWEANDVYTPTRISSVPLGEGVREVDATGFYCCLMKFSEYMKHEFAPFEDILGPDVNLGLHLRREGLKNYIDYSIKCAHLTKQGMIDFKVTNIQIVTVAKEESGTWSILDE